MEPGGQVVGHPNGVRTVKLENSQRSTMKSTFSPGHWLSSSLIDIQRLSKQRNSRMVLGSGL